MTSRVITIVIAALFLMSATFLGTSAEIFTVGGEKAWIVPGNGLNYTEWAQNITARVGDSLYFKYNPNAHDVLKVNSTEYAACNATLYQEIWDTGDTTVVLQLAGTHYFICGAPNHCLLGQAFALEVNPAPSNTTASAPSPGGAVALSASGVPFWLVTLLSILFLMRSSTSA